MKEFHLVLDIPFAERLEKGIVFTKFLPRKEEAIHLTVDRFDFKIYFSYEKRHLNEVLNDFINSQEEIKRHINIFCNSLRIDIRKKISHRIYKLLGDEILNDETEAFCKNLVLICINIYGQIVDYVRNCKKQYWLNKIEYDSEIFSHFLISTRARWDYNGVCKDFKLHGSIGGVITIQLDDEKVYLSKSDWSNLKNYLDDGSKHIQTEDIFIANSLEYLHSKRTRVAILEAVIAFEHFIKTNNSKNLVKFIPKDFKPIIKKLFKDGKFSAPTGTILILMKDHLANNGINPKDILKAIELRNNIMHNSKKEVSQSEARKYILVIKKFIESVKET